MIISFTRITGRAEKCQYRGMRDLGVGSGCRGRTTKSREEGVGLEMKTNK